MSKAEKIQAEDIRGKIVFVGAGGDVISDTCKYIRRMDQRLKSQFYKECKATRIDIDKKLSRVFETW